MSPRFQFWRVAALVVLALIGVQFLACSLLTPETCELYGSQGDRCPEPGSACICCCAHIEVGLPVSLTPQVTAVAVATTPPLPIPSFETAPVYHPPQA